MSPANDKAKAILTSYRIFYLKSFGENPKSSIKLNARGYCHKIRQVIKIMSKENFKVYAKILSNRYISLSPITNSEQIDRFNFGRTTFYTKLKSSFNVFSIVLGPQSLNELYEFSVLVHKPENWTNIPGYRGKYQINKKGQILRRYYHDSEGVIHFDTRMIRPSLDAHGYKVVVLTLFNKPKSLTVHRLVAKTFIPNPHHYRDVNHKDENKLNDDVSNLEWCTPKYNDNYGTRLKRISLITHKKSIILVKNGQAHFMRTLYIACCWLKAHKYTTASNNAIRSTLVGAAKGHFHAYGFKVYRIKDCH